MSNPAGAKICAAFFNNSIKVLIPRDIFAERRIATFAEASFTFSNCSSLNPVVHNTTGICFSTLYTNKSSTAPALEKSIITSAGTLHKEMFENTG